MFRDGNRYGRKYDPTERYAEDVRVKNANTRNELEEKLKVKKISLGLAEKRMEGMDRKSDPRAYLAMEKYKTELEREIRQLKRDLEDQNYGKRKNLRTKARLQNPGVLEAKILKKIADTKNRGVTYVTKEDMAAALNARESQVEQIFMDLNRKGILNQPVHHAPHDSNRDPMNGGTVSHWMSDFYYFTQTD